MHILFICLINSDFNVVIFLKITKIMNKNV